MVTGPPHCRDKSCPRRPCAHGRLRIWGSAVADRLAPVGPFGLQGSAVPAIRSFPEALAITLEFQVRRAFASTDFGSAWSYTWDKSYCIRSSSVQQRGASRPLGTIEVSLRRRPSASGARRPAGSSPARSGQGPVPAGSDLCHASAAMSQTSAERGGGTPV